MTHAAISLCVMVIYLPGCQKLSVPVAQANIQLSKVYSAAWHITAWRLEAPLPIMLVMIGAMNKHFGRPLCAVVETRRYRAGGCCPRNGFSCYLAGCHRVVARVPATVVAVLHCCNRQTPEAGLSGERHPFCAENTRI